MNNQNIITCKTCHRKKETNHWSSDDWDQMCDWVCLAIKDRNDDPKLIAKSIEWHEENSIKVPDWCPLKIKQIVITSPPEPKLPNHYTMIDLMNAFNTGYNAKIGNLEYKHDSSHPIITYKTNITFEEWFYQYTQGHETN